MRARVVPVLYRPPHRYRGSRHSTGGAGAAHGEKVAVGVGDRRDGSETVGLVVGFMVGLIPITHLEVALSGKRGLGLGRLWP